MSNYYYYQNKLRYNKARAISTTQGQAKWYGHISQKRRVYEWGPLFLDLSTATSLALDQFLEYQLKDLVFVYVLIPQDLVWVQCHRHLLSREERRKCQYSSQLHWFQETCPQLFKPHLLTLGQGFHLTQAK